MIAPPLLPPCAGVVGGEQPPVADIVVVHAQVAFQRDRLGPLAHLPVQVVTEQAAVGTLAVGACPAFEDGLAVAAAHGFASILTVAPWG